MSEDVETSFDEERRRRSARLHILLIGGVALFPVVGSFLLYQFWKPSSFINHGELIPPSAQITMDPRDPLAQTLKTLSGKWILATVNSGDCAQACRQKLYYMRQIRLTQGKEMERIERLWIVTDSIEPAQAVLNEHQGMKVVSAQGSDWVAKLPLPAPPASYIFIMDPLGNLVTRYPAGFDATGMKKDLLRLLRASRIG